MLSPNRQSMLLLKKQATVLKVGHKLLKEKRAGLIMKFLDLSIKGKILEEKLAAEITNFLHHYRSQITYINTYKILENSLEERKVLFKTNSQKFSGVYLYEFILESISNTPSNLKAGIQQPLSDFKNHLKQLTDLSQYKINCLRLSREILKTNKQIASIEDKIEENQSNLKFIRSYLQEKENYEKAVLMKIFNP